MFTEKDYLDYFTDLQSAERRMIANMDAILSAISDEKVRAVLSDIRKDEFKHLQLENKLMAILPSHVIEL